MRILSTGEILWDIVEGKEFLGGAPLNFSVTSQRLGNLVSLLTGVGDDELGRKALQQMNSLGLKTDFVQIIRDAPTGTALVTLDESGSATFRISRPAAFDVLNVDSGLIQRCQTARTGLDLFWNACKCSRPQRGDAPQSCGAVATSEVFLRHELARRPLEPAVD